MTVSLEDSIARISDPRNLDETLEEVIGMMLGRECHRDPDSGRQEKDSVTAVVGFGGVLSGACIVRTGTCAALKLSGCMTGVESESIDETVQDGIGELCNMLAGSWKGRIPELAANCALSVPAVITGRDYTLRVQAPKFKLTHIYRVEDVSFEVSIVCDGLK